MNKTHTHMCTYTLFLELARHSLISQPLWLAIPSTYKALTQIPARLTLSSLASTVTSLRPSLATLQWLLRL